MSCAASSMNHNELMPGINIGGSPKNKKSHFDLEMFGSKKPLRGAKTVVMKDLDGLPKKKKKAIDLSENSDSESSSSSHSSSHSSSESKKPKKK